MKKFPGSSYLFLLTKISSMVLFSILIFFFIGLSIDRWLNWTGIGMISGTFIGLFFGFFATYKLITNLPNLENREESEEDV